MEKEKKKKICIKLDSGVYIYRVPTIVPFGNFRQVIVRVLGSEYLVGDGDEYLRDGYNKVFTLGKKLVKK